MLRIHTTDGDTVSVDLRDAVQARSLLRRLDMSGLTLVERHEGNGICPSCRRRVKTSLGVQYSIARPQNFGAVDSTVELVESDGRVRGGERATIHCGDVRLTVMAHAEQPAIRISLSKVGVRKYNPEERSR